MNTPHDPSENPYAAPQAELDRAKPKVLYVTKFNFKLALFSCSVIALILFSLFTPAIESSKSPPRSVGKDVLLYTFLSAISIGLGFLMGANASIPMPPNSPDDQPPEETARSV